MSDKTQEARDPEWMSQSEAIERAASKASPPVGGDVEADLKDFLDPDGVSEMSWQQRAEYWKARHDALQDEYIAALALSTQAAQVREQAALSHGDLCRLSRAFFRSANLRDERDHRINEWVKTQIALALPTEGK